MNMSTVKNKKQVHRTCKEEHLYYAKHSSQRGDSRPTVAIKTCKLCTFQFLLWTFSQLSLQLCMWLTPLSMLWCVHRPSNDCIRSFVLPPLTFYFTLIQLICQLMEDNCFHPMHAEARISHQQWTKARSVITMPDTCTSFPYSLYLNL